MSLLVSADTTALDHSYCTVTRHTYRVWFSQGLPLFSCSCTRSTADATHRVEFQTTARTNTHTNSSQEWYSRFTSRSSGASIHRSTNRCFVLDELLLYGPRPSCCSCVRTNERPKTANQVLRTPSAECWYRVNHHRITPRTASCERCIAWSARDDVLPFRLGSLL